MVIAVWRATPERMHATRGLIVEDVCENVCGDECAYGGGDDWIVGGYAGDDCECVDHGVSPRIIRLQLTSSKL